MKGLPFVLAFTAMTFVAWGAYGPLLHHGTLSMGKDSLRAFVGVGIAYFFIAVLVPIYILRSQGEAGKWTVSGTFYSLIAGAVGAVGALGVILALSYGGLPVYVMPLVFGFAPIVNTLVTAWMSKTFDQISPIFIGGIVVASLGVGGVLAFKPVAPPHAAPTSDSKSKDPSSKDPSSKDPSQEKSKLNEHTRLDRADLLKLVSTVVLQEPVSEDLLPPVVVQPVAPDISTAVPQTQPPQPAPPVAPPVAPVAEPQELPPVVIQPVAPQDTQPAATTPALATAEVVEEPKAELPPTVVQPAPLQQADAKANAPVEPVKPEPAKPEPAKQEPAKQEPVKVEPEKPSVTDTAKPPGQTSTETLPADTQPATESADKAANGDKPSSAISKAPAAPDVPMIVLSIVVAAFCWGSYGPMLHQGQARMGGSRLRPFTCVGLAYFFIAVAAPLAVIYGRTADMGSWSVGGLSWSIIAGAAGAIGALGVILAFNAGGKPYYVMPLVFGFAPVINTCISLTENGTWGLATPKFWISLAVVIAGAITVLLTAPKPKHAKPAT